MYPLTADRKENQFFFVSEFNDADRKGMNLKIKVFSQSQELFKKPGKLYKTNFESLFVNYQGGFAIPNAKLRTDAFTFNAYKFSVENTSHVSETSLHFGKVKGHWFGAQAWRTHGVDEIDCESLPGT